MFKRIAIFGAAVVTASAWAAFAAGRSIWRTWGIRADETRTALPGDDLIPEPLASDTRGIDIKAPPEAVWPWLVQMGYGRAGWYSYDAIDMNHPSLDRIEPELQQLAVGDILPTHPSGGFEVKVVDPNRSLVVYSDRALVEAQAAKAGGSAEAMAGASANVRATGAYLDRAMAGDFRATWAFHLMPTPSGTRLIERFRVWFVVPAEAEVPARFARSLLGFGVFVMLRRQMIGIRARAEAPSASIEPIGATTPSAEISVAPQPA